MNLPALALIFNAAIWGLSWIPFRWFQSHGVHALWATGLAYALALMALGLWKPSALRRVAGSPSLWLLGLAYGLTNTAFNWAVTIGDVVRVVLLFYLMPLWAALFARLLLNETLGREGWLRLVTAVSGAALVLYSPDSGLPLPQSLSDWLAVIGGMGFGLANVLLQRMKHIAQLDRTMAMYAGSVALPALAVLLVAVATSSAFKALVPLGALGALGATGAINPLSAPALINGTLIFALILLAAGLGIANFALQYGGARTPTQVTSLLLLSEIVFASASSVWLGGETISMKEFAGGGLIVATAVWAALRGAR